MQMSRRLGLDYDYYLKLESNENPFSKEICVQLDLLQMSVDKHVNRMKKQPVVDELLKKSSSDQINEKDIDDYIEGLHKLDN